MINTILQFWTKRREQVRWGACLLGAAFLCSSTGCSRTFWRKQADTDSYLAITQNLTDERWAIPRIDITPDPRSRFFDPYDPDCSPLPPDDPAAHVYMHWVNGWKGYKSWHKFGDMLTVENPQWLANFGMTPEMIDPESGQYIAPVPKLENVSLPQAVELSQINDRGYQTELENLYLSALNVTFERFQLGVRYLEPITTSSVTLVEGGGVGRLGFNNIGLRQSLPWGTQLVANLANTTLWTFGAGGGTSSASTMSFQIIQPLLNDAGRKVNLENLTQSERNLLYQARDLARFRKILFSSIVSDYLGLLQQVQAINNERGNIDRLQEQVDRLLAANQPELASSNVQVPELGDDFVVPPELARKLDYRLGRLIWRGVMSPEEEQLLRNIRPDAGFQERIDQLIGSLPSAASGLDALQVQFDLANSVNRLRGLERVLQDSLDSFKISLGLPPDMLMTIDQTLLQPFEFIDSRLTEQEEEIKDFNARLYVDDAVEAGTLLLIAEDFARLLSDVRRDVVDVIRGDVQAFQEELPRRLDAVEDEEARRQLRSDFNQAQERFRSFQTDFEAIVSSTQAELTRLRSMELDQIQREETLTNLINMRQDLLLLVQSASVVQVSSRVELINIADFDLSLEEVTRIAVEQRLDLMNARARVMDARRRIEVIANDLNSILDLGIGGSISGDPSNANPFDFRSDNAELNASLRFDTPLDQIDERNAYRRALITYQREKRNYMALEDRIKADVRSHWRQLIVLRQNLETSRLAVRIAALQYESAVGEGNAPVDPRQALAGSRVSGNQGQNLTRALSSILQAQNQLIANYVSYERNRLNIYRDMDIMEIGPDGIWNDQVYRNLDNFNASQNAQPPFSRASEPSATVRLAGHSDATSQFAAVDKPQREGDTGDRHNDRVRLAGGDRIGDENLQSGVVELRHAVGEFPARSDQPVNDARRPRPFPGQSASSGESR